MAAAVSGPAGQENTQQSLSGGGKAGQSFTGPSSLEKEEGAGCSGLVRIFPSRVRFSQPTFQIRGDLGLVPPFPARLHCGGCEEMVTFV